MKSIFITGISSGIGKGLALFYANKGVTVYGLSRRDLEYEHTNIKHLKLDINNHTSYNNLNIFIDKTKFDLCILHAGVLGSMSSMKDVSIDTLQTIMMTNTWSQKLIIDKLIEMKCSQTSIGISSGAAIKGTLGWAGYSISKAALNMLIQLYASENPEIKIIALAPGLVDTSMQDYLCEKVDTDTFPTVNRLKEARGTSAMPTPEMFASNFDNKLNKVLSIENGTFIDLRKI